jgi:ankyrin repeat protein
MEQGGLVNCAISRGQVSLLKLLVEFKADLNIPSQGRYPLNTAVSSPKLSTDIVQFLLDNGADISLADGHPGLLLNQAIHGTIDTLRLLLDRGATYPPDDLERWFGMIFDTCTVETVHLLLEYGYAPNIEILSIAVRARRGDILKLFIDSGVDLNMRGTKGFTLLHTAIFCCIPSDPPIRIGGRSTVCRRPGRESLVHKIEPVLQRVSPTCMSDKVEKDTPEEIVRCLIRGGADLNALDALGRTPLALARKCPPAIQQMLIDGGGKQGKMA